MLGVVFASVPSLRLGEEVDGHRGSPRHLELDGDEMARATTPGEEILSWIDACRIEGASWPSAWSLAPGATI